MNKNKYKQYFRNHSIRIVLIALFFGTLACLIVLAILFPELVASSIRGSLYTTMQIGLDTMIFLGLVIFLVAAILMRREQLREISENYEKSNPQAQQDYERHVILKSIQQSQQTLQQTPLAKENNNKRKRYLSVTALLGKLELFKQSLIWIGKLLVPSFLISYPSLWDNIKILATSKQFRALRFTFYAWMLFSVIAIGVSVYFLKISRAATFTVDSTGDASDAANGDGFCDDGAGNCTLRAAIEESNALMGGNTINFNIGGGGAQTLQPSSQYLGIFQDTTVDATTQPGFSGTPLIEIDGQNAPFSAGFNIQGTGVVIKGFIINRFDQYGISMTTGSATVEGNIIGTDESKTPGIGNGTGVYIQNGASNTVGGTTTAQHNIISGNTSDGIVMSGGAAGQNIIQGNYIGTTIDGSTALPNGGSGIVLGMMIGSDNVIGGTASGSGNVISGNSNDGITSLGWLMNGINIYGNYIGTGPGGGGGGWKYW